jgi:hypothetical protein
MGSNPTQGMGVCVYSVFVLGSGLATGSSPVQGVLSTVLATRIKGEEEEIIYRALSSGM